MRKTLDRDMFVACPLCHAWPGVLCKSTGGHGPMTGVVHRERRQAADAKMAKIRAELEAESGV